MCVDDQIFSNSLVFRTRTFLAYLEVFLVAYICDNARGQNSVNDSVNQLGKRFAILFSIGKRLGSNDVVNRGVVHQKTITTDNQGSRNQILIRYGFSL